MTKLAEAVCSRQRCTKPARVFNWCGLHARKEADELFARYVKKRDGYCQVKSCGTPADLQCAHIVSRRYFAKRWTEDGAVALCIYHHKLYTENPLAWDRWCIEWFGSLDAYQTFKFDAEMGGMPDLALVIEELRAKLEVAA